MSRRRRNSQSQWRATVLVGALSAASVTIGAMPARAGFLDFLFGPQQEQAPSQANSYAAPTPPVGRVVPPPMGSESVRGSGAGDGRAMAFCVRLCDGLHFPLERMANATPVETCKAMCPAAKTTVYFGGAIEHAAAKDGARYADLDTAFIYQKHAVPNCTCNGKTSFGLVPLDVAKDPTLRPGDIVATKIGFATFSGTRGQTNAFTPVDAAPIVAELNHHAPSRERLAKRNETAPIEEDSGTIVQTQDSQQRAPVASSPRGPVTR